MFTVYLYQTNCKHSILKQWESYTAVNKRIIIKLLPYLCIFCKIMYGVLVSQSGLTPS